MQIEQTSVPEGSLIAPSAARDGHYADCFACANPTGAGLAAFVTAFYTQPLFQAERLVLRFAARAETTDAEAANLASGTSDHFAVWTVRARSASELLLQDKSGRTMSWLQATPDTLRFGSVVTPVPGRGGKLTLGPVFQSLMGAHKLYSLALLAGAARRLRRPVQK